MESETKLAIAVRAEAPESGRPTALVTGATGFTGGHLVNALSQRGYRVRALVREPTQARHLARLGVELMKGDLAAAGDVQRAVAGAKLVFHLGALYRSAKYGDEVYRDVNVNGTRHVLEAANSQGVERVVHCSTAGVHGDILQVPADESAPLRPGDIYQTTKVEGEQLAQDAIERGQPVTIFRPVGIYGPGDVRFLKLFRTIHSGQFRMFGSGKTLYHMTYIDDLVDGIILCGENPAALGETFLLAGPRHTTIEELAEQVAVAVGRKLPRGHLPLAPLKLAAILCEAVCRSLRIEPPLHRRRLDFFIKDRAFDCGKARQLLAYSPRVDLAEGLARTARWYFDAGLLHGNCKGSAARYESGTYKHLTP
jgi:dihydroflavonol-4-reductase